MQEKTTSNDAKATKNFIPSPPLDVATSAPIIAKFSSFFSPLSVSEKDSYSNDTRIFLATSRGKAAIPFHGSCRGVVPKIVPLNERVLGEGEDYYCIMMAVHRLKEEGEDYVRDRQGSAKSSDIESPTSAFVEIDFREDDEDKLKEDIRGFIEDFGASMVVESSPGKLHVYWRYNDSHKISWESHQNVQYILARRFGGDFKGVALKTKLMRVAGYYHNKDTSKEAFLTPIHHCDRGINYLNTQSLLTAVGFCEEDVEDFHSWVKGGGLEEVLGQGRSGVGGDAPIIAFDPDTGEYKGVGDGDRDEALFNYILQGLIKRQGITDKDKLLEAALAADKLNTPPIQDTDGVRTVKDKCRSALARFQRSETEKGIKPAEDIFKAEGLEEEVAAATPANTPPPAGKGYDYTHPDFNHPVDKTSVVGRMLSRYSSVIAHYDAGGFFVYNGRIWAKSENSVAVIDRYLRNVVNEMHQEPVVRNWFTDRDGNFSAKKMKIGMVPLKDGEDAILKKLSRREEIKSSPDDFETENEEHLLAVKNGVLDLRDGSLLPHSPKYKLVHELSFEYNPDAKNPVWEEYVETALEGDQDTIRYLQQVCGYLISGCNHIPALIIFLGPQGSGKSTAVNVLQKMMGGYSEEVMEDIILEVKGGNATAKMSSLAQTENCRFVTLPETSEDQKWSLKSVKSLTGKDRITAKLYHKDTITYTPRFKMVLRANDIPTPKNIDEAFWVRLKFVPFHKTFRNTSEEISDIEGKIKSFVCDETGLPGYAGVLAWCVKGFQDLMAQPHQRFLESDAALEVKGEQRALHDNVGAFYEESLEACAKGERQKGLTVQEISELYYNWLDKNGLEATEGWEKYFKVRYKLTSVTYKKDDGSKSSKRVYLIKRK